MIVDMPEVSNELFCPLQKVADALERKWSFQIIYEIGNHKKIRFNELQGELRDISPKTLSDTLKKLENESLINKKFFSQMPPKVEYSLTKDGLSLYPIVVDLLKWSISRKNSKIKECSCFSRPHTLKKSVTEIIIINDNKSESMLFQSLLEHHGCHVIGIGYDRKDAVRLYQHHTPEVIFIDVCMPEFNGFQAIKGIRETNPDAKIVVTTADTSNETQERLEKLNVSSILHKPFSNVTLEHVLKTELKIQV
jgi:DNA-binding HxlR family transcriptional regulator/CheY-like chemotaxis protein